MWGECVRELLEEAVANHSTASAGEFISFARVNPLQKQLNWTELNWTELRTRLSLQSWCSSSSSASCAAAGASCTCKEVSSPEELNVCVQSDYHFFKWFQHYLKVFRPNWKRFLKWLLRCLLTAAVAAFAVECSKLCSSLQSVINSTRNTHSTNKLCLSMCVCVSVCLCLSLSLCVLGLWTHKDNMLGIRIGLSS